MAQTLGAYAILTIPAVFKGALVISTITLADTSLALAAPCGIDDTGPFEMNPPVVRAGEDAPKSNTALPNSYVTGPFAA